LYSTEESCTGLEDIFKNVGLTIKVSGMLFWTPLTFIL